MLTINAASAVAADADARFDAATVWGVNAVFGPGAVVRERPWTGVSGSEEQTGIVGAAGKGLGASGPCVTYPVPLTLDRFGAIQASPAPNSIAPNSIAPNSIAPNSTARKSTARKSTVQHSTNEMTRLYPATRGGVGPHPAREPEPV